jgi:hypothetical protein
MFDIASAKLQVACGVERTVVRVELFKEFSSYKKNTVQKDQSFQESCSIRSVLLKKTV